MIVDVVSVRWMSARLFGGDRVRVITEDGHSVVGVIDGLQRSSLTIRSGEEVEVIHYRDIVGFRRED